MSEDAWVAVGERVRQARLASDLTQGALASQLRIDRSALARIESGERHLSAMELYALASALQLPLSHFVTSAPTAIASHRQDLSDDADELSRKSFRIDALLQAHARDADWLRTRGFLEASDIDLSAARGVVWGDDDGGGARAAAAEVRRALGLDGPIHRMADALATAGLYLLVVPHLPGGASLLLAERFGVAIIGGADDTVRRRMTAAHELGHFALKDEYRTDIGVAASRDEREQQIEAFAAEFLLPSFAVEREWAGRIESPRRSLIKLSCEYGASWSATVKTARRAGVLSPSEVTALRAHTPTLGEIVETVGVPPSADLSAGETSSTWQRAVLAAYRDSAITAERAVELVHGALAVNDLPDLAASDQP